MALDRELNYVAANQAYLIATSLRREEIIGRNVFEVLTRRTPDIVPMVAQPLSRPSQAGPVLEERSAEEARGAMAASGFDVLFTDVSLPGASGVDLAREVAERKTGMKVILASGHGNVALPRGETPLEGVVVLPKPYSLPQIQEALAQAVALP